jgi:hypothetical protein
MTGGAEQVRALVIGGGSAGLAVSHELTGRAIEHVRWYAVAVTNRRVFVMKLRLVHKAAGRPLVEFGSSPLLEIARSAIRRGQDGGHGAVTAEDPQAMEPDVIEWIDTRSAVSVGRITFGVYPGFFVSCGAREPWS